MHNLEFWLDKPFRVLLVLIGAVVVSAVVRLLIRKVTRGIARGTQSRIVKRLDHGQSRWVQDAGVASERQALRARTSVRCWLRWPPSSCGPSRSS